MLDKAKAILATIKAQAADIWNRSKMFILAIAGIILAIEFQKIKDFFLVYAGQKEIKKDQEKDQNLAKQEKEANDQANALIEQAKQLPSQQEPVSEDWYTKQKGDK